MISIEPASLKNGEPFFSEADYEPTGRRPRLSVGLTETYPISSC
jgi:hypothetical protein